MKTKSKKINIVFVGLGVLFIILGIVCTSSFSNNKVISKTKKLIEKDLGVSVKIAMFYYNQSEQECYVAFETENSVGDKAAVYLKDNKILYDSDSKYWQNKFETAISDSEIKLYSAKFLEYDDLIFWDFGVISNGIPSSEGWKKLK